MNVTPSKLLLGVSLAAYAYISWDHLSGPKSAAAAAAKGEGLTAGTVNRIVQLKLDQDPFNSVPLNQTVLGPGGVAGPGSKEIGDLSLDGVMVTVAARAAVINGKSVHEGDTMKAPGGATIRIKKIGIGYCVIEGAGQTILLKVSDPKDDKPAAAGQHGESSASGGSSGGASSATGNPYHSNGGGGGGGSAPARPAGTSATGNPYKH
jgi:hypothetical protein